MPLDSTEGTYIQRNENEILDILEQELQQQHGADIDLTEGSVFQTFAKSQAHTTHIQEASLQAVHDSAFLDTANNKDLDRVVEGYGLQRTPAQHATGWVRFSTDSANSSDYTINKGTTVQTGGSDAIQFETTEAVTLQSGTTSVDADVRAIEGGPRGNVGANTIVEMPSPPEGVDSVTNPDPTGDEAYTDTDGDTLVVGTPRETDAELRERAKTTVTKGGDATVDAVLSSLLHATDGSLSDIRSVTLFNNRTTTDNTGTTVNGRNGLPPKSGEVIVHGGGIQDIVNALASTGCITDQFVAGYNGTKTTADYTYINDQQETWAISRPSVVDVDITISLLVDDTFVGKDTIRDQLIDYTGGTAPNGDTITGLGAGEDVRIDKIREIVTEDGNGVVGFDQDATTTLSTTPSMTTTAIGLSVVSIGSTEVSKMDGTDGSITINTTTI